MTVTVADVLAYPKLPASHGKKLFFDSPDFHVWIHADRPGEKGPMHKHTADEIFYCVQGSCTFHFPDRPPQPMKPGMVIMIPKGDSYMLDNDGTEYLILLGARAEGAGNPRFDPKNTEVHEGGTIGLGVEMKVED
jgi:mannose-6-phosphate isomerase-like protein (cupin superfamily)